MQYFPIIILYIGDLRPIKIYKPEDVECGRRFRVLATRFDLEKQS